MKSYLKPALSTGAAFSSLISGIFWHLSADAQLKALELSNSATVALAKIAEMPVQKQVLMRSTIESASKASATFSELSASQNLWAAVFAVAGGVTLAILAALE
jgi:hypothetical protein